HDGHSGKQLGINFPEAMKWLWRNEPVQGKRPEKADGRGVFEVLVGGEGWRKILELETEHNGIRAVADDAGNLCYIDIKGRTDSTIRKVTLDGKSTTIAPIMFGRHLVLAPGGKLIAATANEIFLIGDDGVP